MDCESLVLCAAGMEERAAEFVERVGVRLPLDILRVLVTAAGVQDSIVGAHLLDQVAPAHPGIRKV